MSPLRRLLGEITNAREAVSLDEIARRVGVSRDEADAMVAYWVRKGRLTTDDLAASCPTDRCGTCPTGANDKHGCGSYQRGGPVLLVITRRAPG